LGVSTRPQVQVYQENLTEVINEGDDEDSNSSSGEEEDDEEEEVVKRPAKESSTILKEGKEGRAGGGGLSVVKEISDELANFLAWGSVWQELKSSKALWTTSRRMTYKIQKTSERLFSMIN
jgi:hypothetical protein